MGFKNTITPQAGWEGITQAAIGTISLFQARQAKIDYGNKVSEIETKLSDRGAITNPYQNLENPYKNLSVATQAARIQAEEADIALANTLDTLRATGKSAGGATALAQAALRSKKDISASIEQQEVNNEKLKADGQLQVDIARGKGEIQRMMLQERRTEADLGRLQNQADLLQAQQFASRSTAAQAFGAAGKAIAGGIVPKKKELPVEYSVSGPEFEAIDPNTQSPSYMQNISLSGPDFAKVDSNNQTPASMRFNNLIEDSDLSLARAAAKAAYQLDPNNYQANIDRMATDPSFGLLEDGTFVNEGSYINPFYGQNIGSTPIGGQFTVTAPFGRTGINANNFYNPNDF